MVLFWTASPCYDGHLYLNNTCLEVVPDPPVFVNWSQARSICSQKFGRLAVLDSPILESILSKLPNFGLKKNYYIGNVPHPALQWKFKRWSNIHYSTTSHRAAHLPNGCKLYILIPCNAPRKLLYWYPIHPAMSLHSC